MFPIFVQFGSYSIDPTELAVGPDTVARFANHAIDGNLVVRRAVVAGQELPVLVAKKNMYVPPPKYGKN